jgi:hypothetical protein
MELESFTQLIGSITSFTDGRALDKALENDLNDAFPAGGPKFLAVLNSCREAIEAGWMCNREGGGIKYGRVIKASPATHGFSVDVVEMDSLVGPHHRHPNGEIDLVMPLTKAAKFDDHSAGWVVYEPGSAHRPTVTDGKALILYLLPSGAIEFSKP